MIKIRNKKSIVLAFICILILFLFLFFRNSFAIPIDENDVEVNPKTTLKYFLTVSYDGIDSAGTNSETAEVTEIKSGLLEVEDRIPEGLEFLDFETTSNGRIGAIEEDSGNACIGMVVDDTKESSYTEGKWNENNTEYTYHGLHYNAETKTVHFKVKNLRAGCKLTVGVVTKTPEIDDPETERVETRRDFYNFATGKERTLTNHSNTVHVFMGNDEETLYNVSYQYSGTVPRNAPQLPQTISYAKDEKVGIIQDMNIEGYEFSGWTTNDVAISNNSFNMPERNVVLTGSFTEKPKKQVNYQIVGEQPENYVIPRQKEYYVGENVEIKDLKKDSKLSGYKFSGWESEDVEITDDYDFIMPDYNVTLTGRFEKIEYKVYYTFNESMWIPDQELYLPEARVYEPGEIVHLETIENEPEGYKFVGWLHEDNFRMPEEDVTIYGEWKYYYGEFEPQIEKEILNPKEYYNVGDQVEFKITIRNPSEYNLYDVIVEEESKNSLLEDPPNSEAEPSFYEKPSDHIGLIHYIESNTSKELKAFYTITEEDPSLIESVSSIQGAQADYYGVDMVEKDYNAKVQFKTQPKIIICSESSNTDKKDIFEYNITNTRTKEKDVLEVLESECKQIILEPGEYQLEEKLPNKLYNLEDIIGPISIDNKIITIDAGEEYKIIYRHRYKIASIVNPLTKFNIFPIFITAILLVLLEVINVYTFIRKKDTNQLKEKMLSIIKTKKAKKVLTILVIVLTVILRITMMYKYEKYTSKESIKRFLEENGIYSEEKREVEISSNDYDNPSSWKIKKKAEWISKDKVKITFDVKSVLKENENKKKKDIILAIDTSGSMNGKKLEKAINDSKELIEFLLDNDPENRFVIVTFNESATNYPPYFTSNKEELIEILSCIDYGYGNTSYTDALDSIYSLLSDEENQTEYGEDRELITLFLTDGYPNERTSSQAGKYKLLKDKYPFMSINGIQYEMGITIIEDLKKVTDIQFVANQNNLKNVLIEAAVNPIKYESFKITDYINDEYFNITSENDIRVSNLTSYQLKQEGKTPIIEWTFDEDTYATGGERTLSFILKLEDKYSHKDGFVPTNKKEIITYKLPSEEQQTIESKQTPVLKTRYHIHYQLNLPSNCQIEAIPSQSSFIGNIVDMGEKELYCEGYVFKGWEINDDDYVGLEIVNKDMFIMPGKDVRVTATWGKYKINKTTDGRVEGVETRLYDVLKNEALSNGLAKEYEDEHQDSIDESKSTEKVYHWYAKNYEDGNAILNKNNVIFANRCWQMIRTTDTGGVKMIYNGEPENGKCLNTRGKHVEKSAETMDLNNTNYYYFDSYKYENDLLKIEGEQKQINFDESTKDELIGKYTCKYNSTTTSCANIYEIKSFDGTIASMVEYSLIYNYAEIGKSSSEIGYMKNDTVSYEIDRKYTNSKTKYKISKATRFKENPWDAMDFYYSNTVTETENGMKLVDPIKYDASTTNYSDLIGKYTILEEDNSSENSFGSVYYVANAEKTEIDYIYIKKTEDLTKKIYYGSSITYNDNGTFTINDSKEMSLIDYYSNYSKLNKQYVCFNEEETTCQNIIFIISSNNLEYKYTTPILFSNSFTYSDGKYHLNKETLKYYVNAEGFTLGKSHYTCMNLSTECETVNFATQLNRGTQFSYITMENGNGINEFINQTLIDYKNTSDSLIKKTIEDWFEIEMKDYKNYLEDVIYCNDKRVKSLGAFSENSYFYSSDGYFKGEIEFDLDKDIKCNRSVDSYSVNNPDAKIKYPVGLMTYQEALLMNSSQITRTGSAYWFMTAKTTTYHLFSGYATGNSGSYTYPGASYGGNLGVRPVISLKPGTLYIDGDGSMKNPYVIEIND